MTPNFYGSNRAKSQTVFDVSLMNGSDFITDTAAHTRTPQPWIAIQAVAAVVATIVDSGTTLTSIPIPAGTTIWGAFSSITLASGKVLAYR